jgi:hypothetical protein
MWATISDVEDYTGETVSMAQLNQAQSMIELFADTTPAANPNIQSKNTRLLKMAVAYQAAWLTVHPDVFTNTDISQYSADGQTYSPSHANSSLLAPMAKRAIDRLSWRKRPQDRIRKIHSRWVDPLTNRYTSAVIDDENPFWQSGSPQ